MVDIPPNLQRILTEFGFTNYEAKTYLCLLKNSPATGYEISQQAHVPRSVVYSVLRRLEGRGFVLSIHEKPHRYLPLAPKQLIARLQTDFGSRLNALKDNLSTFNSKPETEGFWNIRGYDSLMSTCEMLIKDAQHSVYISGWYREIERLSDAILNARKRNVDVVIFSFNAIDNSLGEVFCYGISEEQLEQYWDHKLIVVTDNNDLVMGSANQQEDEQAIWTQNRAVLTIAVNYIILDITLFGQRVKKDISQTVNRLRSEHYTQIDHLIAEALRARQQPLPG